MNGSIPHSIEIPLAGESFESALAFVEEALKRDHISDEILSETVLLFEEVFHKLIEQDFDQNTLLTISTQKTFGEINIKFGFEGKRFAPVDLNRDIVSPEDRILHAYGDKVDFRYSFGYNSIRITVRRSYQNSVLRCFSGILLAILVYIPINLFVSREPQLFFEASIIYPLTKQYANMMMMVGAPVTLFSMIRNLTDTYIVAERSSSGRRLQIHTILTSSIAVILAAGTGFFAASLLNPSENYQIGFGVEKTFSELLATLVPSNIFEPFETFMPFPMIIVALLCTYASCSVGRYFDPIRKAVDSCYILFSKMLHVVMSALPFFSFVAVLTPLLLIGYDGLFVILKSGLLIFACLIVLIVFYLLRLLIGGVPILPFLKELPPLIRENLKINSALDAVPFNIRYCARHYGYDRKRLSEQLPILAQTNMDGNCYILMLIVMFFIILLKVETSWFQITVIAILVLFLSFGAPNQPGGILIGMLIITFYLEADDLIDVAIYSEVFFGAIQNIINVVGDIVTVAIENQKSGSIGNMWTAGEQ